MTQRPKNLLEEGGFVSENLDRSSAFPSGAIPVTIVS